MLILTQRPLAIFTRGGRSKNDDRFKAVVLRIISTVAFRLVAGAVVMLSTVANRIPTRQMLFDCAADDYIHSYMICSEVGVSDASAYPIVAQLRGSQ